MCLHVFCLTHFGVEIRKRSLLFWEEMRKINIDSKISWPLKAAKYERTRLKMYPVTMMRTKHSPIWSNRPSRKACLQGKLLKVIDNQTFRIYCLGPSDKLVPHIPN